MTFSLPWNTKKIDPVKNQSPQTIVVLPEAERTSNGALGTKEVITQVAKQRRSAEEKLVETKQIVTFELDKEEYAAPILDLKEIIRTPEIISVPAAPAFIKGIFNLRGQIVVVIDLEKRFALKREHPMESRDIIIVEIERTVFGVMVDEVTGVLRVPITSIKSVPPVIASKIHADYLSGVIILEESRETKEEAEITPKQIQQRLKTQKQAVSKPGQARLLLLLDLPKMLSEEELLGFGTTVRQMVEEI